MHGDEIKKMRLSFRLTQEEFAHQLGVTHGTVSRWENRKNRPSRIAVKLLKDFIENNKSEP